MSDAPRKPGLLADFAELWRRLYTPRQEVPVSPESPPAVPVCVACGRPAEGVRSVKFLLPSVWRTIPADVAGLVALFALKAVLVAGLVPFINYLVLSRRVRLPLPVCDFHDRRWATADRWCRISVWLAVGAVAAGIAEGAMPLQRPSTPYCYGLVYVLVFACFAALRNWPAVALAERPDGFWLTGVPPEFVSALGRTPGCLGCGYDMTGNTSGRCPECGKETPGFAAGGPGGPTAGEPTP
jgi:hypothetical protein